MSARRRARAPRALPAAAAGQVPPSLRIGRCVEVWTAEEHLADPLAMSARRSAAARFAAVRSWWLQRHEITSPRDQRRAIRDGSPWSVTAAAVPVAGYATSAELAAARLAPAGGVDMAALRREAVDLFDQAPRRGPDESF
ncbi:hypothetical protein [Nocardioides sp. zg-DK7169]|uniref:hypothetical protein n=1 Tax=Nocardioides sp. zg-DK7169 TaxID=2736600 RepID=UPI0015581C26|nr:hypothetical protein [Nocardioides sp. zg-DK7169]NPC96608.1 hypothetical protein [Nocardioides sp. zg-DK7169]